MRRGGFGRRDQPGSAGVLHLRAVESLPRQDADAPAATPAAPPPVRASASRSAPPAFSAPLPDSPPPEMVQRRVQSRLLQRVDIHILARLPRPMLARQVDGLVREILGEMRLALDDLAQRHLVTALVRAILGETDDLADLAPPSDPLRVEDDETAPPVPAARSPLQDTRRAIQSALMERIDVAASMRLPRKELARQISDTVVDLLEEMKIQLNLMEQRDLVSALLNEMLGLGPLEPLLADESITDIMVNGPNQIYVERRGKLELTDICFRDNAHVMNIATRIVTRIGRRIDESQPLVDARLEDGSRVNIIAPPLAIDGASISIRKFSRQKITLDRMASQGNLSEAMAKVLKVASRSRLNILISGGTGSGKTTLLNAMSRLIDHGERVVTIEDAAELQLQQPHVVRLETRPPNLEGGGEITMRDLVKNALRMRPDRIIIGEVRGAEALDMLQAMNTGHDGSMSTIHANTPREALARLENMVAMAGVHLPASAVRTQIASAIGMIVQVSRMRDGMRRVTSVTEITGMEGDIITTQELFAYRFEGEAADGRLSGTFTGAGLRPAFLPRAEYFGLGRILLEALT